ncbi:MAG: TetR family transcriptional regulator [Candidatus Methanoplasma sp.]|jgi:AcrR family transcriptional regulator|nr:TetR family transcriptional regulator [Candidatus Methanoplasma sp.]
MRSTGKKTEIVRKTSELLSLAEDGSEITTRRIAENAGINPAMVNYYFGSKDGLLKAAVSAMNGDLTSETHHDHAGSRKEMFDILVGICETSIRYTRFGLGRDAETFSKDALETSSKLIGMKRAMDEKASDDDPAAMFKIVCFLMAASADPERFAEYSGTDIRIKAQLRSLVSRQLDILLGDAL